MCEFEDFLQKERRKGISKVACWTAILLLTTAFIMIVAFSVVDAATKHFFGV